MRSVLNLTITQMVLKVSKPASNFTGDGMTCIENDGNAVEGHAGFDWSEEYQGVILGAFYWLYVSFIINQTNDFNSKFNINIIRASLTCLAAFSQRNTAESTR